MDLTKSEADGWRMRSRKSCRPKKTSAFSIPHRASEILKQILDPSLLVEELWASARGKSLRARGTVNVMCNSSIEENKALPRHDRN